MALVGQGEVTISAITRDP